MVIIIADYKASHHTTRVEPRPVISVISMKPIAAKAPQRPLSGQKKAAAEQFRSGF